MYLSYFLILIATSHITEINCGLLNIFDPRVDGNLLQMMDLSLLLVKNNVKQLLFGNDTTPVEQSVTFWCGNTNSQTLKQTFLDQPLLNSNINPTKPMWFITHGWFDSHAKKWVQETAQNLMQHLDTNVCAVGWKSLAHYSYFQTVQVHTQIVSNYLTKFITRLVGFGIPPQNINLVGHSLGAHISGQVGFNFGGQIGAIYGLDPPEVGFTLPTDRGHQYRIDRSDARYVQIIIVTRNAGGLRNPDGHENFFPNGGLYPQPNCVLPLFKNAEFSESLFCSHLHVTTLFKLSILPKNKFIGRECASYEAFQHKRCLSSKTNLMGIYSDRTGGDFYLKTAPFAPFVSHKNAKFLPKG